MAALGLFGCFRGGGELGSEGFPVGEFPCPASDAWEGLEVVGQREAGDLATRLPFPRFSRGEEQMCDELGWSSSSMNSTKRQTFGYDQVVRRADRAAEGDGLENRCVSNGTGGSNPSPSANWLNFAENGMSELRLRAG